MEPLTVGLICLLFCTGVVAGCVDAIAGGGGIITLPMLLSTGMPPILALGTNKFQNAVGTAVAVRHFIKNSLLEPHRLIPMIVATFVGASIGAILVQTIDASHMADWLPLLIMAIALYFLFSPKVGDIDSHQRISQPVYTATVAPLIGFYDGVFGPGTGSFFALSFVAGLGFNLRKATAHAKILNLASNATAVLFFIAGGKILWTIGLIMAAGQIIGGRLGAQMVVLKGTGLIRPLLILISFAVTLKLIITNADSPLHQAIVGAIHWFNL